MAASSRTGPEISESTGAGGPSVTEPPDVPLVVPADRLRQIEESPLSLNDSQHAKEEPAQKNALHYLRQLKRRFEYKTGRLALVLQFAAVGLSGMVVDLLSFALAHSWLPLGVARALCIWAAMTWNYILNRHLTFSHARTTSVGRQYLRFCASCLAGALVNWSFSVALCIACPFFAQAPLVAAVIGILAGFVFNYYLSCRLVFRSREPSHVTGTLTKE
jgi:dolichol-phosphate mannosyltransferase